MKKAAPPWMTPNPKSKSTPLSPKKAQPTAEQEKEAAKGAAKKAGRPYPNLVDNMKQASGKRSKG